MLKNTLIKLLTITLLTTSLTLPGCKKNKDKETLVSSEIKIEDKATAEEDKEIKDEIANHNFKEKFEKAKKQNSDTVTWIYIPNTTIDSPVVQDLQNRGTSNEEYYIHIDFNGNRVAVGRESAIMSVKSNVLSPLQKISKNIIISGHNVDLQDNPNGKMFAPLGHFKNLEFSKKTPYIFLTTEDGDLVYQVFASYYAEERAPFPLPINTEKEMSNMIADAKERSNFIYPDVKVTPKDKILTLYTCTYHFGTYKTLAYYRMKYVVQAVLLPENHKLAKYANVTINPHPKKINFSYCAKCGRDMTIEKCSANGGLCDKCKK